MELRGIEKRLDSIDHNLAEHMKRTSLLERKMVTFDSLVSEAKGAIRVMKFIGYAVALVASILEVIRFFS